MQIIFLSPRTIGSNTYQIDDIVDLPKITALYLIRIRVAESFEQTTITSLLNQKVDKIPGSSLISDFLAAKIHDPGPTITVAALPPDNPSPNDLWFPTD